MDSDCYECGVDLGPVPYDQWTNYSMSVFLSSSSSGRVDISINGIPAGSIVGAATTRFNQELTRMHLQIVDFAVTTGTGIYTTVDYDDVFIVGKR